VAGQYGESSAIIPAFDDGHGERQDLVSPVDQATGIAAISPDQVKVDGRSRRLASSRNAPLRSWTEAAVTSAARSRPRVSTAMCACGHWSSSRHRIPGWQPRRCPRSSPTESQSTRR
jgi:hypothetical protein